MRRRRTDDGGAAAEKRTDAGSTAIARKIRDTGGLSMVEMLCVVVILVLLSLMMNSGMEMAIQNYHALTVESETELLLSSLTDALADRLRYAIVTENGASGLAPYTLSFSEENGMAIDSGNALTGVTLDGEGRLMLNGKLLLPDGAYGERGYQVEAVSGKPFVTYDPSANSFLISLIVKDDRTGILQETEQTVRCLSPRRKGMDN